MLIRSYCLGLSFSDLLTQFLQLNIIHLICPSIAVLIGHYPPLQEGTIVSPTSGDPTCGLADGKPSGIKRQPLAVAPVPAFLVRQPQWVPRRLIPVATDNTQPEPLRLDSL